jgi:hypothetical protein
LGEIIRQFFDLLKWNLGPVELFERSTARLLEPVGLAVAAEKFHGVDAERVGNPSQGFDGWGIFAAFEHANVVAIEVRTMSKVLLRNAFGAPNVSQVFGD